MMLVLILAVGYLLIGSFILMAVSPVDGWWRPVAIVTGWPLIFVIGLALAAWFDWRITRGRGW